MAESALRTFAADVHAHARLRPCRAAARPGRQPAALSPGQSPAGWQLR
jgi:hypothetical protein